MNVLDLFSGIGGFSLGLERAGMRIVAFCECNPYCRAVLAKHWPGVPCYDDVRTIPHIGGIDLICGGFPCQPFSHAGKQLGTADDRHLWPAMLEVIKRERPTWVIGENVVGIIAMELDAVLADLEAIGYACQTFDIPAGAVGAPHIRRRVWVVACDSDRNLESACAINAEVEGVPSLAAHASGIGLKGLGFPETRERERERIEPRGSASGSYDAGTEYGRWWQHESGICRVVDGVPESMDRLRSLGNAVVPQIPEIIGRAIMRAERG